MSHKYGRVVLSTWVEPALRDYAREAAKVANLEFSRWVERAVRQPMARESANRLGELLAWGCNSLLPDVPTKAPARVCYRWDKNNKPRRGADGRLVPCGI